MSKELEEDIKYIKYGIKELKDSYELHNRNWAETILKEMNESLNSVLQALANSISKDTIKEKKREVDLKIATQIESYENISAEEFFSNSAISNFCKEILKESEKKDESAKFIRWN